MFVCVATNTGLHQASVQQKDFCRAWYEFWSNLVLILVKLGINFGQTWYEFWSNLVSMLLQIHPDLESWQLDLDLSKGH